jgi:hypothetical protein
MNHSQEIFAIYFLEDIFCYLRAIRSMDMISPALHDLHYQPMVYDLLPVKDDVYDFQGSKMILGEGDFLWSDFRHLHIGECSAKWTDGAFWFRWKGDGNVVRLALLVGNGDTRQFLSPL